MELFFDAFDVLISSCFVSFGYFYKPASSASQNSVFQNV